MCIVLIIYVCILFETPRNATDGPRTVDRLITNEKRRRTPTQHRITPCKNSKFSKIENTGPSQTNIDSLVGPVVKENAYLLINFTAYTRRHSWRRVETLIIYIYIYPHSWVEFVELSV
jgi:hypothetical protein